MLNEYGNTSNGKNEKNKMEINELYRLTESPINARKNRFNIETNLERNHMFFCLRSNTSSIITNKTRNGIFFAL